MMEYAVQYSISSFTGAYAHKYSVIIYDAGRLEALFRAMGSSLVGFAAKAERREYDPFECFQGLMKLLKQLKKDSKRSFCVAIERTDDETSERALSFCDEDEAGGFEVRALGFKGICVRSGVESEFETMTGKKGTYRAELSTVLKVFNEELLSLVNLCEDTMMKDARLIAQVVPNDTPAPPPLFQL
ncbi:MAG: hypothetical protein J6S69_01990 [Proteobacteria bacterium]|nr:hypothetical protein [Pseudomonadota bacterium]